MTYTKEFTWYRIRFRVTWQDGTTETVVSHHNYERDTLYGHGPRLYIKRKESIDARAVGYLRPWIRKKKVKVDFHSTTERTLNFEKIKSIDHVETEAVTETVTAND